MQLRFLGSTRKQKEFVTFDVVIVEIGLPPLERIGPGMSPFLYFVSSAFFATS